MGLQSVGHNWVNFTFTSAMVVSSTHLRLLIFLLEILIPVCASSNPAFLMMYSASKLTKQGDNIHKFHSKFWTSLLFHVCFCFFLTCIQIFQEAGKVVWYSHLFQNFPQFIVIHRVKGFGVFNKAEVDILLEFSCFFFYDPMMLAIWSLVPLPFLNPAWTSGSWQFMYCWSLAWRILSIY